MWFKKVNSDEYLELKKDLGSLKLVVSDLSLELALILKKLKFKYKITTRDLKDEDETEDLKSKVLLPDNGLA